MPLLSPPPDSAPRIFYFTGYIQIGPMIRLPLGSVQVGPYFQRNGDFRSHRSTFEPARLSNFTTVSLLLSVGFNSSP